MCVQWSNAGENGFGMVIVFGAGDMLGRVVVNVCAQCGGLVGKWDDVKREVGGGVRSFFGLEGDHLDGSFRVLNNRTTG